MSIKVQCGQCRSVMNVRDDYAGTQRQCPKCKSKFRVPTREEIAAHESSPSKKAASPSASKTKAEAEPAAADDFDPVSFLTGEKPAPKTPEQPSKPSEDEFDPLDVLGEGHTPSTTKKATPKPESAPPEDDDFDPMAVLGDTPTPPPKSSPEATPKKPDQPVPKRPSWAKAPPEPEQNDWEEPTSEPEKPQPKRPSWAKTPPPPEEKDWEDPAEEEKPKPKRPAWAKPLPGESPAEVKADNAPDDASAAVKAASEMVGTVMASGPPPEEPRGPLIDVRAIGRYFRSRAPLMLGTLATATVLFGLAWWLMPPYAYPFDLPSLVSVKGQVTVDGTPLPDAIVRFHPTNNQWRSPIAMTDSDGRYELSYTTDEAGAPPGRYRVQIEKINENGRDAIPSRYGRFTRERYTVAESGATIDIEIKTRP